ncbi:MAG: cytochrome c peroxidase [Gemmatimonadota bacterium]
MAFLAAPLMYCADEKPAASTEPLASRHPAPPPPNPSAALVRQLAAGRGVVALPRRQHVRPELVELGRALAFDKILSGNRDISCMTCHLPQFATGDDRSLSIGQGAQGSGPERVHPQGLFIPRNAPPAFNLAAMQHLFWDGRVEAGLHGRLSTPAGSQLTPSMRRVLEFGPVSAIGMFPVGNRDEMRAYTGNELAAVADSDNTAIWEGLMHRLGQIPEYRHMFERAYPGQRFRDMTFAHASNAIGGFLVDKLTFDDTPWDRFLAGRDNALTPKQLAGAQIFMTIKCSLCHNGATFSDEKFHDVAVAQFGPGKGNGSSLRDDFGRMNVTGDESEKYRFRTSPLRNVELTAPYGHDGAMSSLRDFIAHYSESDKKLLAFDPLQLEPALRSTLLSNAPDINAHRDTIILGVVLTDSIINSLTDYMSALTDDRARDLGRLTPRHVPSGLRVDR